MTNALPAYDPPPSPLPTTPPSCLPSHTAPQPPPTTPCPSRCRTPALRAGARRRQGRDVVRAVGAQPAVRSQQRTPDVPRPQEPPRPDQDERQGDQHQCLEAIHNPRGTPSGLGRTIQATTARAVAGGDLLALALSCRRSSPAPPRRRQAAEPEQGQRPRRRHQPEAVERHVARVGGARFELGDELEGRRQGVGRDEGD